MNYFQTNEMIVGNAQELVHVRRLLLTETCNLNCPKLFSEKTDVSP